MTADPRSDALQVRGARASSVIAQTIPKESVPRFLEWQSGIAGEASRFAGYQSTEVFPPVEEGDDQWVVIVHFDDASMLRAWLESKERAAWTAKLTPDIAGFRIKTLPKGFGPWFGAMEDTPKGAAPPGWKMALTVLFALYPTVMGLSLTVGRHTAHLGMATSILVGNALSVVLLQWAIMPVVERMLRPWVTATSEQRAMTVLGAVGIVVAIGLMALGFRAVAG